MADEVSITDAQSYPQWKILGWRWLRGSLTTLLGQLANLALAAMNQSLTETTSMIYKVDWNDPRLAARVLFASFIAGFLLALGKAVREQWGDPDKTSKLDKIPI